VKFSEGTPSLYNDDELAAKLSSVFVRTLGEAKVEQVEPVMGAEDFSLYGKADVPILMYRLGSVCQRRLDQLKMAGQTPPSLHSAAYDPDFELTLQTSIATMTNVVLDLLPRQ
jgi:metal-dependent amidase/aminoacylase/carboxypeptidase family protein